MDVPLIALKPTIDINIFEEEMDEYLTDERFDRFFEFCKVGDYDAAKKVVAKETFPNCDERIFLLFLTHLHLFKDEIALILACEHLLNDPNRVKMTLKNRGVTIGQNLQLSAFEKTCWLIEERVLAPSHEASQRDIASLKSKLDGIKLNEGTPEEKVLFLIPMLKVCREKQFHHFDRLRMLEDLSSMEDPIALTETVEGVIDFLNFPNPSHERTCFQRRSGQTVGVQQQKNRAEIETNKKRLLGLMIQLEMSFDKQFPPDHLEQFYDRLNVLLNHKSISSYISKCDLEIYRLKFEVSFRSQPLKTALSNQEVSNMLTSLFIFLRSCDDTMKKKVAQKQIKEVLSHLNDWKQNSIGEEKQRWDILLMLYQFLVIHTKLSKGPDPDTMNNFNRLSEQVLRYSPISLHKNFICELTRTHIELASIGKLSGFELKEWFYKCALLHGLEAEAYSQEFSDELMRCVNEAINKNIFSTNEPCYLLFYTLMKGSIPRRSSQTQLKEAISELGQLISTHKSIFDRLPKSLLEGMLILRMEIKLRLEQRVRENYLCVSLRKSEIIFEEFKEAKTGTKSEKNKKNALFNQYHNQLRRFILDYKNECLIFPNIFPVMRSKFNFYMVERDEIKLNDLDVHNMFMAQNFLVLLRGVFGSREHRILFSELSDPLIENLWQFTQDSFYLMTNSIIPTDDRVLGFKGEPKIGDAVVQVVDLWRWYLMCSIDMGGPEEKNRQKLTELFEFLLSIKPENILQLDMDAFERIKRDVERDIAVCAISVVNPD